MPKTHSLLTDTQGVSGVEHIIIITLVGLVGMGAWQGFGATLGDKLGMGDDRTATTTSGGVGTGAPRGGSPPEVSAPSDDGDPGSPDPSADDGALGRGDSTGLGAIARGVTDGVVDVVGGAIEGGMILVGGVWEVVTNPSATAAVIADAVTHPGETADAAYAAGEMVVAGLIDAGSELVDACASGDGYACSRGVTNVAANFIPIGAAGTVGRGVGRVVGRPGAPLLPRSVGAAAHITMRSRIAESPFAVRQARALSQGAQRDVDHLITEFRGGNANPGLGTRSLGGGFYELRGHNTGRVIIKQHSAGEYDIVGKFQGHVRGDAENSRIIRRFMTDYESL